MMNNDVLRTAIKRVVSAANTHLGQEPSQQLLEAINNFAGLDEFDAGQKLSQIATALADVTSASGAGIIAVWLGASVEQGMDTVSTNSTLTRLLLTLYWSGKN